MIWVRKSRGLYWCREARLALELGDDGWWYLLRADGRGRIVPDVDALGWELTLSAGKRLAEKIYQTKKGGKS